MNQNYNHALAAHFVVKTNLAVAGISVLQFVLPGVVAGLGLLLICRLLDVEFDQNMMLLAGFATVLCVGLVRARPEQAAGLIDWRVVLTVNVVRRWLLTVAALLLIGYMAKLSAQFSRRAILSWVVVTPFAQVFVSLYLQRAMRRVMSEASNLRSVLFVGVNEASLALASRIRENRDVNLGVAGFFDDRCAERLGVELALPLIGRLQDVPAFVKSRSIDMIFVALPVRHLQRVFQLIEELRDTTASIYYVPDIYIFDLVQARTRDLLGIPVIAMCETPFAGYRGVAKRVFDLLVCIALLPLLAPLMLLIALCVKLTTPGPVIFRQRRYGLDGSQIAVYKFRTMYVTEDGDHIPQATVSDPRITSIGRFLRRYSLDELPQIFNVLRGTMSLVGPRPHAVAHNEQYRKVIKGYMIRHKVAPGITGLAQINGCRGETARLEQMQARVDYDLEYLRRWSPLLDIKILAATVLQMFAKQKPH